MNTPKQKDPTTRRSAAEGADFNSLPPQLHAAVRKGLFGTGQRWNMLSALLSAEPGRLIAVAREIRGWSQQELADKAAVRQPEVSVAEKQFEAAKIGVVRRIAKALDIPISMLIADQVDDDPPGSQPDSSD